MLQTILDALHEVTNLEQVSEQVSEQVGEQVKKTIDDLYEYCKEPHSMTEIQKFLGLKSRPYVKSNYVDILMKDGRIKQTIPDKPNSSKQKYISI